MVEPIVANKSVMLKALGIARTPKSKRVKTLIPKKSPSPRIQLSDQAWFRRMVDRIESGHRIYAGYVKGMGLSPDEKVLCDHTNCRHRENFHSIEVPIGGSGHLPKSQQYPIVWKTGKNGQKEISVMD
jgi:hypothetical protein